jgi:hypothetical protein
MSCLHIFVDVSLDVSNLKTVNEHLHQALVTDYISPPSQSGLESEPNAGPPVSAPAIGTELLLALYSIHQAQGHIGSWMLVCTAY